MADSIIKMNGLEFEYMQGGSYSLNGTKIEKHVFSIFCLFCFSKNIWKEYIHYSLCQMNSIQSTVFDCLFEHGFISPRLSWNLLKAEAGFEVQKSTCLCLPKAEIKCVYLYTKLNHTLLFKNS